MTIAIPYTIGASPSRPSGNSGVNGSYEYGDDIASVLAPISITDEMMVSITAGGIELTEDAAPLWNPSATYAEGDRVYLQETHRVYESIKDGNANRYPGDLANQFNAAGVASWWIDAGPTNRYAMFDALISTQTVAPTPLAIVLRPGSFNGIAMFGLDADEIDIVVTDYPGGTVVYSYSASLEGSQPSDYYEYFFDRFKPQTQFIATDLIPYGESEIRITLTKGSGDVRVGMIALGDLRPLGEPLRGASVEPIDYSYVSTDTFGNTTVRKRNNATSLAMSAKMDINDANSILDTIKEVLGVPVVVVGSKARGYENLTVFGLLSGRIQHDDYGMPTLNMTVKGLI